DVPAVRSLGFEARMLEIAKAVMGPNAFPFRTMLFDKSAQSNWLVPCHQDTAVPLGRRRAVGRWWPCSDKEGIDGAPGPPAALRGTVAIRVHVDNSNGDNGALRVLPGTDKNGVVPDDEIHEAVSSIRPVEWCAGAGAVLIMMPLLCMLRRRPGQTDPGGSAHR